MAELALQPAVDAVLRHRWVDSRVHSAHERHNYDSSCAVCRGDVAAILAVAAPVIVAQERERVLAILDNAIANARREADQDDDRISWGGWAALTAARNHLFPDISGLVRGEEASRG